MVGSTPIERVVGTHNEFTIVLKEEVTELTGLVFNGYQEIKQESSTQGNSQTLKIDDISKMESWM